MNIETRNREAEQLLQAARARLPQLQALLAETLVEWCSEDSIYRLYHHSFKCYRIQAYTLEIVAELRLLVPHLELNDDFTQIIADGTGKEFDVSHNENWLSHTLPMTQAFFHAKHMLEMVCKYAEKLEEPPETLPSGWATVLYLYNLR